MIKDFHELMSALPPPATLLDVAKRQVAALKETSSISGRPIDAEDIALLTVRIFSRYLFSSGESGVKRDAPPPGMAAEIEAVLHQRIVAGSWEWRKEIAVRGEADAEVSVCSCGFTGGDVGRAQLE